MHYFKELKVWNKAMEMMTKVYKLMSQMPQDERYALTSQIKRCAVSIPSNIAEGAGRSSDQDFARFVDISNGSTNELETQLLLARNLGFIPEDEIKNICSDIHEIQKMNYKLLKSLRQ